MILWYKKDVFKLFDRYILKEIFPPFVIGLFAYTFVLMMQQILLLSEMFIAKGVALASVIRFFLFLLPSILAFTIPMSVLLGILAGLSRMSSNTEITALRTLGVGQTRMLKPILFFAFCGWLASSFLSLYLAPRANYQCVQVFSQEVVRKVQFEVEPRRFYDTIPNTVIYFQDFTKERHWQNIFVFLGNQPNKPRIVFADEGRLHFFPQDERAYIELYNGILHSYPRGNPREYSMTSFESLEEEIDIKGLFASISHRKRVREKDVVELFRDVAAMKKKDEQVIEKDPLKFHLNQRDYNSHKVEIHKKFAIPFSCFIFAFLALPLGASTRKGGRTSGFTISIGLIIVYYVLLTAGEQMSVEGNLSPFFGMWGPNILFVVVAGLFFVMTLHETTPFSRLLRKREKDISRIKTPDVRDRPKVFLRFPNILDRYILRKYVFILFLAFISVVLIFCILTFFERIDSINEHNKPLSWLFLYILYSLPHFIYISLPAIVLVSTLLSLGLLTKFNEITAMKACGISLYRTILPVIVGAILVSLCSFYLQENIIPNANKKAEETWDRILDIPPRSRNYLDRRWVMGKNRDRIFHYRYYDPVTSTFNNLSIYDLDETTWSLKKRLFASKAFLMDGKLFMNDSWHREFEANLPVDYEEAETLSLDIEEDRAFFLKIRKVPDQMDFGELRTYIKDIEERNFETRTYRINLHYKIAFPFACIVMALLGISFAFSMGKRGALVGLGLSLVIAMVFWGCIGVFRSLGHVNFLSPLLAAWGPNIIFGLIGLYLIFSIRT
jgi:LPS export ABC transporter permease LptG/LPS export ABC transporter permease LptF